MLHLRSWFAGLLVVIAGVVISPAAKPEVWPAAFEGFINAMQEQRIVRMEIVHITSIILTTSQLDSTMFDGFVNYEVYTKQPDADCDTVLNEKIRAEILLEFRKYPVRFTGDRSDINWRIRMFDAKNRLWHSIYIAQAFANAPDVLMIVDGQMMKVDRRFVEFLANDNTLNRCRF